MKKLWIVFIGLTLMAMLSGCGNTRNSNCGGCSGGNNGNSQGNATATMVYVCPMHSQVQSSNPGKCTICGMSLVQR